MNIKIIKSKDVPLDITGGEYAVANIEIWVNNELPLREQQILVIHSIIENYFPSLSHDKIDEIISDIENALDELQEVKI